MNEYNLTYISSAFSFVVFIPIILMLYLTITKRIKLRPVLIGIATYMAIYALSQSIFIGIKFASGNFMETNYIFSILTIGILTPIITQLLVKYSYTRILTENRTWQDGVGFGLGMGTAWVISTIGIMLFLALSLHLTILDGTYDARLAEFPAEEAKHYLEAKNSFLMTTPLDYVLFAVSGCSAIIIYMALSVLVLMSIEKNNRNFMYYAISSHMVMYIPFYLASGGIVNIYTGLLLLVLAILSVIYLVKTYDKSDKDSGNKYYSRPSPLLGRK